MVHENSSLNKTVYFGHVPNSGQYLCWDQLWFCSFIGSCGRSSINAGDPSMVWSVNGMMS